MENQKYPEYTPMEAPNKSQILKRYYAWLAYQIAMLDIDGVQKAMDMIEDAYMNHKKMYVIWNGWSWATATHFGADMTKTIFGKNPLPGIEHHPFDVECIGDNIPTMTATGNDLPSGFDHIFSLPLQAKAKEWELLLVITGSWNSGNIIKALEVAKAKGMKTLWFLGFNWWKAKEMLDHSVVIESDNYGHIEDMHSTLMHAITDYFKKTVGEKYNQK